LHARSDKWDNLFITMATAKHILMLMCRTTSLTIWSLRLHGFLLKIWQLLTALLGFLELKHSHLHIVSILNIKAEKTPQHFNCVAVIGSFLTIDARMGRVMKRRVLQNTGPCLQAHYSSLGPARGLYYSYCSGLCFWSKIFWSRFI
jgi:hypothetical protein